VGFDWSTLQPGQQVEVMVDGLDKPRLVTLKFEESALPISYTFEVDANKAAWMDKWVSPTGK
jgi:hypothetical protein